MMRPRNVGCPKIAPDADCRRMKTANASGQEEKCRPVPNVEPVLPVLEENPYPESGLFGAKPIAVEVAKHLKIHPSTVYKMAKRGELPGFKIGTDWRFDRAQIEEWIRSRIQGLENCRLPRLRIYFSRAEHSVQ